MKLQSLESLSRHNLTAIEGTAIRIDCAAQVAPLPNHAASEHLSMTQCLNARTSKAGPLRWAQRVCHLLPSYGMPGPVDDGLAPAEARSRHRLMQAVHLSGGRVLAYDQLCLCTGAYPKVLPGRHDFRRSTTLSRSSPCPLGTSSGPQAELCRFTLQGNAQILRI